MNFRDIWTIAKKELKAGFTDKVVLFQIVLMPFLIVFGYALLMVVMGDANTSSKEEEIKAYYVNAPEDMVEGLKGLKLQSATEDMVENLKNEVKEKTCELVVVFPNDFAFSDGTSDTLSNIEIWYNSTDSKSGKIFNDVNMYFSALQPKLFSVNDSIDVDYDMGDEDAMLSDLLAGLMPIILLTAVYMVVMNLAAESVAGDKERGFLNTMLIAPIKHSSIAAGKAAYTLIVSILGGLSAFVGMSLALPKLAKAMELDTNFNYKFKEYMLLFAVTITAVFALASILLLISTIAKDVKQATTFSPVVMVILLIGGMLSTTEGFKPMIENIGMVNNLIPTWNTILLMQDIIRLDYSVTSVYITCGVNLLFSLLSVCIIGKCFESEKILNG